MATFQIDPNKVAELSSKMMQIVGNELRPHLVDTVIALTEAMGRIIAAQDISPIAMRELATVSAEHLERTIRIGVAAKGGSMGDV